MNLNKFLTIQETTLFHIIVIKIKISLFYCHYKLIYKFKSRLLEFLVEYLYLHLMVCLSFSNFQYLHFYSAPES